MSECWNSVTVYGPASEIRRFKQLCIKPTADVYRNHQFGWDGCSCSISAVKRPDGSTAAWEYVWNFQQFYSDTDTKYSFSFDSDHEFPVRLFQELAEQFPKLAFDCNCIDALDSFMGYGWFNPREGGESFAQDYVVPENYWTSGSGYKRSDAAQRDHEARVARLQQAALDDQAD